VKLHKVREMGTQFWGEAGLKVNISVHETGAEKRPGAGNFVLGVAFKGIGGKDRVGRLPGAGSFIRKGILRMKSRARTGPFQAWRQEIAIPWGGGLRVTLGETKKG